MPHGNCRSAVRFHCKRYGCRDGYAGPDMFSVPRAKAVGPVKNRLGSLYIGGVMVLKPGIVLTNPGAKTWLPRVCCVANGGAELVWLNMLWPIPAAMS